MRAFGAPPVQTTEEHPFYARKRERRWNNDRRRYECLYGPPMWVEASQLTKEHFLAQPWEARRGRAPTWVTGPLAYVIGRWLGDGWIVDHKRKSKIVGRRGSRVNSRVYKAIICANRKEASVLEAALRRAGLHPTRAPERTVIKFHLSSRELVERLRPFGRGAAGKKLAPWVASLPVNLSAELLRGWLDSDGDHKRSLTRGCSISRALTLGLAELMRKVHGRSPSAHLHIPKETGIIEGRRVRQRPIYSLRMNPRNHQAFRENDFAWVPVREVRRTKRRAEVFNLEVEEDHSYVADSFVVHNCQDLSVAGTREGLEGEKSGLWHEYARILRVLRPRYVFVENVTALRHFVSDGGMGRVLGDLVQSGYDAEWDCVPAVAVGAPHVRDRIFILGWRRDLADAESDRRGSRSRGGVGAVATGADGSPAREDRSRRSLADADEAGRAERRGPLAATPTQGAAERRGRNAPEGFDFPPPPSSPRWIEWLERHPGAQPGLRRGDDGFSTEMVRTRRRRLRALGNAVVPQAAERAWELLFRRAQEQL